MSYLDDDGDPPDLDSPRTFFNPHPGFAGAAIPIPRAIKKVADELDGQTMPLKDAVARLKAVGIGEIGVVTKYDYISLRLRGGGYYAEHIFRVICYRSADVPDETDVPDGRRAKRPI